MMGDTPKHIALLGWFYLSCCLFLTTRIDGVTAAAAAAAIEDDPVRMQAFLEFWDSDASQITHRDQRINSISELADWLDCYGDDDETDYATTDIPIPSDADYGLMVEAYVSAMTKNRQENPSYKNQRPPSVQNYNPNAFSVDVEVRVIPDVGRGLFAKEDITKGSMISRPTNALEFYTHEDFRDFAAYLVLKRAPQLICDTFLWMYAMQIAPGEYIVCCDADATSLINENDEDEGEDGNDEPSSPYDVSSYESDDEDCPDGATTDGNGTCIWKDPLETEIYRQANVGQHENLKAQYGKERTLWGCQDPPMYALKDIRAGEELIMSYGDFSEPIGFEMLGLFH